MPAKPHSHPICPAFASGMLRLVAFAAIAATLARVAVALPQDAAEQVRKLQGGGTKVEAIPPGKWTLVEHIHNPDGHADPQTEPRQVQISGGVKTSEGLLIEEQGSGRILLCEETSANSLKAWKQYKSFQEYLDAK